MTFSLCHHHDGSPFQSSFLHYQRFAPFCGTILPHHKSLSHILLLFISVSFLALGSDLCEIPTRPSPGALRSLFGASHQGTNLRWVSALVRGYSAPCWWGSHGPPPRSLLTALHPAGVSGRVRLAKPTPAGWRVRLFPTQRPAHHWLPANVVIYIYKYVCPHD